MATHIARRGPAPTFTTLLERSGKSMSRIAREAEVSISTVSRIASGDRIPSLPMVFKLARVLQVDYSTLLESFQVDDQEQRKAA